MEDKKIRLFNGDCIEVLKSISDNSIDLVVTSPPYNKKFFNKNKKSNQIWNGFSIDYNLYDDNMPINEYEEWMISIINILIDKIKPNGSIFFNHKPIRHDNMVYHPLQFILNSKAKIYQEIIWNRKNSPNIRKDNLVPCTERVYWLAKGKPKCYRDRIDSDYISEVWNISPNKQKNHPAPFPNKLVENCILLASDENDTVLDPFMGSGTTGIVCAETKRKFIGIELDKKYFDIADECINNSNLNI